MWTDVLAVLCVVTLLGFAAQPIAAAALAPLPGGGAGLARPLGILLAAVPLWFAASVGLVPSTTATSWVMVALVGGAGLAVRRRVRPPHSPRILVAAEVVFLLSFLAAVLVVSHAPAVWGTEKPMDMALMSAAGEARHFPPHELWLSGHDLNYYYLGQYLMAFVVRLAGVGPTQGYNLAVALVWALGAAAAFGVGASAATLLRRSERGAIAGGLLAALLTVLGSNVDGLGRVLGNHQALRAFDWFDASRVVPGTVNDFPSFEAVLGDLHAHVIAVPFLIVVLAFVLHAVVCGPQPHPRVLLAGLAVGALYPINAWSLPIALGLLLGAGALRARPLRRFAAWAALLVATTVLAYVPFTGSFDPAGAAGLALNTHRAGLGRFVGALVREYGFALVPIVVAIAATLPRRTAAVGTAVAAVATACATSVAALGGPMLLAALLAGALAAARHIDGPRRFAFLVTAVGLACALAPELVYVRDAFDGTSSYRFNTAFKLGFHAWLFLGLGAAIVIADALSRLTPARRRALRPSVAVAAAALVAFPVAAAYARTGGFAGPATLDGLRWMAPGERAAIAWLRAHTAVDAVVLEAAGPEYSRAARISSFSGRPTVVNWSGHLLFRGESAAGLDARERDVREIYKTSDRRRAAALLRRYHVAYVLVGGAERSAYGTAGLAKFDRIGRRVFTRGDVAIYERA